VRKMVDGADFDPCECIWSHELATRRLIDLVSRKEIYLLLSNYRREHSIFYIVLTLFEDVDVTFSRILHFYCAHSSQ
jgi:hypothetical protein